MLRPAVDRTDRDDRRVDRLHLAGDDRLQVDDQFCRNDDRSIVVSGAEPWPPRPWIVTSTLSTLAIAKPAVEDLPSPAYRP